MIFFTTNGNSGLGCFSIYSGLPTRLIDEQAEFFFSHRPACHARHERAWPTRTHTNNIFYPGNLPGIKLSALRATMLGYLNLPGSK